MAASLEELAFAHDEAFLIPVEALSPTGISEAFAEQLSSRLGVHSAWVAQFNRGYGLYWQRSLALADAAPDFHFPPRRQNLCIVRDPARVPPYFLPFDGASWQLQFSDFEGDPSVGADEYAAFIFLHSERLVAARDMGRACIDTLSYWLTRSETERQAFAAHVKSLQRPDAELFQTIAGALSWVAQLFHVQLKPPPAELVPQLKTFREAGLYIPGEVIQEIMGYAPQLRSTAEACANTYIEQQAQEKVLVVDRSQAEQALCGWLREEAPSIRIVDPEGESLWRPEAPEELQPLRQALSGAPSRPLASMLADLKVIATTSQSLATRCDLSALPQHSHDMEDAGGVYIDAAQQAVVYSLVQPGRALLKEAAPPFHRLLLATRTAHEWGHLCHEAGWVDWPEENAPEYRQARNAVRDAVAELLEHASPAYRANIDSELEGRPDTAASLMLKLLHLRASDYASNLIAKSVVTPAEFSAYVRANVHSNTGQGDGAWSLLARQCYEYQYLRLGDIEDAWDYFLGTSWFENSWVAPGHLKLVKVKGLFDAVAGLFALMRVNPTHFRSEQSA